MNSQEFIDFANRIALATGANAAAWRSSVSRAYYGVLRKSLELLSEVGSPCPSGTNPHHYAKVHLQQSGYSDAVLAGKLLGDLHHQRVVADYKLEHAKADTKNFAILNIKLADMILSNLVACGTATAKAQITQGIAAYRAKISPS